MSTQQELLSLRASLQQPNIFASSVSRAVVKELHNNATRIAEALRKEHSNLKGRGAPPNKITYLGDAVNNLIELCDLLNTSFYKWTADKKEQRRRDCLQKITLSIKLYEASMRLG